MWGKKKEQGTDSPSGSSMTGDFEEAAARVTAAESIPSPDAPTATGEAEEAEHGLVIREEWAEYAARACFLPPAKLIHPAYALTDHEAAVISPKMQAFLQAVADKYAPAALSRVMSKYPEFTDLTAALAVLYFQKWRFVSRIIREEAEARARAAAKKPDFETVVHHGRPEATDAGELKPGQRTEDGVLVI